MVDYQELTELKKKISYLKIFSVFNIQLRRIHILEQERQVLTSGLQALERARDWFNTQLSDVQERIKSFGKSQAGSNVI